MVRTVDFIGAYSPPNTTLERRFSVSFGRRKSSTMRCRRREKAKPISGAPKNGKRLAPRATLDNFADLFFHFWLRQSRARKKSSLNKLSPQSRQRPEQLE